MRFLTSSLLILLLLVFSACENKSLGIVDGVVFLDTNNNGVQDANETGLEGVQVELTLDARNPKTTSDSTGYFRFRYLLTGPEVVLVTAPSGMRVTTSNAQTRVNVLETREVNMLIGIGKSLDVGSVGGKVFSDINANGKQDASEVGLPNAVIDLTTLSGKVVTVKTDNNGDYLIDQLLIGDVGVKLRDACGISPSAGSTRNSRVYLGDVSVVQAFGVIPINPKVTGLVFNDINGNSVQDSGELGLAGWTVYSDVNNNAQYDLSEPAAATCSDGRYALPNVPDGTATIRHVMNLGYTSSVAVNTANAPRVEPFIVGGTISPDAAYPFMVAMIQSNAANPRTGLNCGGSLITPNWIMTAAHCVIPPFAWDSDGNPTEVVPASSIDFVLGTNQLKNPVTRVRAAQIIVHPKYNAISQDYDMTLIRLSRSVNFQTVQPLLPEHSSLSNVGMNATVIGWGDQAFRSGNYPIDLHEVVVPIYDQIICNSNYSSDGGITNRMICAGYSQGKKDSCQGDSGGPLLVSSGIPGLWRESGIVSKGNGCAEPNSPGVYTRVTEFNAFLEAQLGRGTASSQVVSIPLEGTLNGISFAVK